MQAHKRQIRRIAPTCPRGACSLDRGPEGVPRTPKTSHCGRDMGTGNHPWGWFLAVSGRSMEVMTRCIARRPELWFEGPGFPNSPAARPAGTPLADDSRGGAPRLVLPSRGTARRTDGFSEGAATTMFGFKRWTAAVAMIGALIAGLAAAWA